MTWVAHFFLIAFSVGFLAIMALFVAHLWKGLGEYDDHHS